MKRDEIPDLWSFEWWVPDRGYVWRSDVKSDGDEPPFLMTHPDASNEEPYAPIMHNDEPGNDRDQWQGLLFEHFAKLEANQETILAFANEYGWLGIGKPIRYETGRSIGESLEEWGRAIDTFRDAYRLWRWIQHPDGKVNVERSSQDCIALEIYRPPRSKYDAWTNTRRILLYRQEDRRLFDLLDKVKVARRPAIAAHAILIQQVNKHLRGNASPHLLLAKAGQIERQPYIRPANLLAAIWVQLYQAIMGLRVFRPCVYCNQLIDATGCRSTKKAHWRCMHNKKVTKYRKKRAATGKSKKA